MHRSWFSSFGFEYAVDRIYIDLVRPDDGFGSIPPGDFGAGNALIWQEREIKIAAGTAGQKTGDKFDIFGNFASVAIFHGHDAPRCVGNQPENEIVVSIAAVVQQKGALVLRV